MGSEEHPGSPPPEDKPVEREPPPQQSSEDEEEGQPIDPETSTELLRSSWELASTIQFCRMFSSTLRLKNFSADFFERAVLYPEDHQMFLSELVYKLLRPDATAPYNLKDSDDWEHLLHKKFTRQWHEYFPRNPLRKKGFFEVSPLMRVENPEYTSDALRHYPIGEDGKGNRYYYFAANNEDCRLYREEPPKKKPGKKSKDFNTEQAGWFTQCTSLEEFQEFVDKLSTTRNKAEKQLHEVLSAEILPKLAETANQRRKAEEKAALLEAMPRKRSDRIQILAKKKEEEEREKAEREVEERRRAEERAKRHRELDPDGRLAVDGGKPGAGLSREDRFRLRQERLAQMTLEQQLEELENGGSDTSSSESEPPQPSIEPSPQVLRHSERKRSRTQSTFIPQLLGMSSRSVHQRRRTGRRRPQRNVDMLNDAAQGIFTEGSREIPSAVRAAKRQATEAARRAATAAAKARSGGPQVRVPQQAGPRPGQGQRHVITTSLNDIQRTLPTVPRPQLTAQEQHLLQRQRMLQQMQQESANTAQQQAALLNQQQHLLQLLQHQRQQQVPPGKQQGPTNGGMAHLQGQDRNALAQRAGMMRPQMVVQAPQQQQHQQQHQLNHLAASPAGRMGMNAGQAQLGMGQQQHHPQHHPQQTQQRMLPAQQQQQHMQQMQAPQQQQQQQHHPQQQQQQPSQQQQHQRAVLEQLLRQLSPQQQLELQSLPPQRKQQVVMQLLSMHQQRVRQQQQQQQQQQQHGGQMGQQQHPHISSLAHAQLEQQQRAQQLQRGGSAGSGSHMQQHGAMGGLSGVGQGMMGAGGKMLEQRGMPGGLGQGMGDRMGPGGGSRQLLHAGPTSPNMAMQQPGGQLARIGSGINSNMPSQSSQAAPTLFGVANPMRSLHGGPNMQGGGQGVVGSHQLGGQGYPPGMGLNQGGGRLPLLPDGNFDFPFA